MLSKFKLFEALSHSGFRRITNAYKADVHHVNALHYFLWSPFSTITESPHISDSPTMTESPELPGWVKFSEKENPNIVDPDDDFVIPSVANWVENQKLHDQTRVVRHMPSDGINSDVEKISKILKTRYPSADAAAEAINGCGVSVSESLVEQLLKRFSNDWIPAFGVFMWAKAQTGFRHSVDSCNLMVDILGKSKKFNLMWELVEEMDQLGGYVTLVTMAKIMRRFARAGKWEDAIETFRGIERFGVNKDISALNTLLDALVKENGVEHAHDVFLEWKDMVPLNSRTFNVLIHGWCKARKLENAQKAMKEMEKYGVSPDVVTYTSFIEAHCREKDFRKVDAVLEEMQEKGCPPNIVTYTIVMHARGKARQLLDALQVYETMKRNGCVPDAAFYSSLIYFLNKSGRLKDARDIFEDMSKQGVTPDVLTYNTEIAAACEHSQEETALKLLQKMEEASCKPDVKTYAPLLKMCCRKKRMKVLSFLLSHMFKNDISLELGTYSLLVKGLCNSGKLEHACMFFEELVLKGFVPKDSTYKLLMKELEAKSMEKAKEQIEKLMLQATTKEESTHLFKVTN
ncbi:hypothetical protein L1049_017734 [Liquidambar formosana]|uniref:PROP1-like PPR domain-containing protein n=1 Tax=Liquidambar formosana TaxID=63359 RepID=A0AAP0S4T2_LIQFO